MPSGVGIGAPQIRIFTKKCCEARSVFKVVGLWMVAPDSSAQTMLEMNFVREDSLQCEGVHRTDRQAPKAKVSIKVGR